MNQSALIFSLTFFFMKAYPFPYGHIVLSTNIILIHLEGTWGKSLPGVNTHNSVDCVGPFEPRGKFCRDHLHSLLGVETGTQKEVPERLLCTGQSEDIS